MAEKETAEFNDASSRMNATTIALEEAETDIKEIAKDSVYKAEPEVVYLQRVGAALRKRIARVRSPTLKNKSYEILSKYAVKVYKTELDLFELYVGWYITVREAKRRGVPNAAKLYTQTKKEFGTITTSFAFKKAIATAPPIPPSITATSANVYDPGIDPSAYNSAAPLEEYHNTYLQRVATERNLLIMMGAEEDDGLTLRNLAEMTVRYDHQKKMISDLRDDGVNLVYIEPHANCSKRCEKYQVGGSSHPSGLYSLDGSSGTTAEGVKYVPLEFATNNPADQYTTQSGKVYQNGCILGYNCRHKLIPYKPYNQPIPIPERVIKNRREVEMTQREMERDIRYLRGAELQATSAEEKDRFKKLVTKAEDKYKNYSLKNNMAYYIRRTEIF